MKVKFTEGLAALDVPEVGRVERGEEAEVSTELGEQLLEQGWVEVGAKKRAPKKKTAGAKKRAPKKTEAASPATTPPESGPDKEVD